MGKLLEGIRSPRDIKSLDREQLSALCEEMREVIIETVSHNGGHLASNLGVVELTVALCLAFDPPKDSIVWDGRGALRDIPAGRKVNLMPLAAGTAAPPFRRHWGYRRQMLCRGRTAMWRR